MVLSLEPIEVPGVYRRGSKLVVVDRVDGRRRKRAVESMADARAMRLQRDGEARAERRGPTLHAFGLSCVIATRALGATACGPARAVSTVGCWSRLR